MVPYKRQNGKNPFGKLLTHHCGSDELRKKKVMALLKRPIVHILLWKIKRGYERVIPKKKDI